MGAPYMWLNMALEDALHSYLGGAIDQTAALNMYRMADATAYGAEIKEPALGILCDTGRAFTDEVYLTDNVSTRLVTVRLTIRTHAENQPAATARAQHALHVGMVMDALHRTDLVAELNAQQVPNLAVNQVGNIEDTTRPEHRSYVTELTFDVVCHVKGDA